MRQDFRIKTDLSKIYQDERKFSWIYVDHTKIFYVNHLIEHIQKIFNIKKPFHLLTKSEETFYFLPYEEDVRVLENNDTVLIIPRPGDVNQFQATNQVQVREIQNDFIEPSKTNKKSNPSSEKSFITEQSLDNSDAVSIPDSFYRTALHETIENTTEDTKMNEDLSDSTSVIENSTVSSKRKRIRKKKKKQTEIAETDTSGVELTSKKPKIVDSVTISSGKHIRFEVNDSEEQNSNHNVCNGTNSYQVRQSNGVNNKPIIHKDLAALLSLRQSSTPLTFSHKRVKRGLIPESINETEINMDTSEAAAVNNTSKKLSNKSATEVDKSKVNSIKENSQAKQSISNNDTVSFKVFKMGEDYTPQVSSVILARVLNHNEERSQYTLQILHGKEELQEPEGKFALPKDEDENDVEDVITLEESKLLELTSVQPVFTASAQKPLF